jgi:ATP-dependent exoDNAse (exonuclease V) alpha subunit
MPLADARNVDLGYASTSHSAQGATVDRVLVNIDSSRSAQVFNGRMCYVAISRARLDARIYNDDQQRMRRSAERTQEKELALDVVEPPRRNHVRMSF